MGNRIHRGRRSQVSLEFRRARLFCFKISKYDPKLQERVFMGSPEDLQLFIEASVEDPYLADIPDCPKGLVLADNHCTGAFQ